MRVNAEDWLCNRYSDMQAHVPTLKWIGSQCDHVTELGLRGGTSTKAFMLGRPQQIHSYDTEDIDHSFNLQWAQMCGVNWSIHIRDVRKVDLEETDCILFDTEHTYEQLKAELVRHKDKARDFLVFHDTVSHPEIIPAIEEELSPEDWDLLFDTDESNGLRVYRRRDRSRMKDHG